MELVHCIKEGGFAFYPKSWEEIRLRKINLTGETLMNPVLSAVGNAPEEATNMNLKLLKAATSGKVKRLEAVFRENIDISIQTTPIHDTAIHIAAGLGHLEIITGIHKPCPALFSKANDMGDTALHRAARAGHYEVLSFLVECSKTSPSTDIENGLTNVLRKGNKDGDTIMHESVRSSELKMVKLLIADDPQLLCIDNKVGESPLHIAVEKGKIKIIEEIMKRDRYSCNGPKGRTSLHAAIIHKRRDITKLLLDKNPELLDKADDNKRSPLHFAAGLGLLSDMCMLLTRNSSKPCLLDNDGFAPIHMSARFGELDIVKKFIQLRPDLKDLLDAKGRNILHIAVESQQVGVVKYILQSKELNDLVNGKDEEGNTPLHQAAITGNSYIVNLLVWEKRVNVTTFNDQQQTALDITRSQIKKKEADKDKSLVLAALLYASSPPWSNHNTLRNEIIQLGKKGRKESLESYKSKGNILIIVATLVATVTYAAGFTPPGGYQSEGPTPNDVNEKGGPYRGEAILKDLRGFHIYLSGATVGVFLSVGAILVLIWLQFTKRHRVAHTLLHVGQILIVLSITSMVVAFIFAWMIQIVGLTIYSYFSRVNYLPIILILVFAITVIAALGALFRVYRVYLILGPRRSIYLRSWIHECMRKHENQVSTLFHYSR